ncbi:MAG: tRNA (guanosine(46)-N7)-methyltransferase TrmB [Bacteroidales bacterium]
MSGKNKLKRFAENKTFANVIQPDFKEVFNTTHHLHGKWNSHFWKNQHPIVLELGCGKGEYTVSLAQKYPEKNFIGIDIKGARFWRGAKTAIEQNIPNVAFVRTRVEFITSLFAKHEISEIWITFPDPQKETRRTKKRLTSSQFLNMYYTVLRPGGNIHLKTDSQELYAYTQYILTHNNHPIHVSSTDIYNSHLLDDVLSIQTHYEKIFRNEGKKITYTRFSLPHTSNEPPVLDCNDLVALQF